MQDRYSGRSRPMAARQATALFIEEIKRGMKLGEISRTRFKISQKNRVLILHLWLVEEGIPRIRPING